MSLDVPSFFKACNPTSPLAYENPRDRQFYIDFSTVRGSDQIRELKRTILMLSEERTSQLFTGQVGCGKSTELRRLKAELEELGFLVVYFESSDYLDLSDLDVTDILLAISHQVSQTLEAVQINLKPNYFVTLFEEIGAILQTPIEFSQVEFSVGISKLTAKTKDSPRLRQQLRQFMEPRTNSILKAMNEELLAPAIALLRQRGQRNLVVIIDNLDRVDARPLQIGRTQPEYLFIDRGDQLSKLNCHLVYTIPLALVFSNENETLKQRFGGGIAPKVLPMVPVYTRDHQRNAEGIHLLRHMILARAFPGLEPGKRLDYVPHVFDGLETLDRLCMVTGGHVRNLLGLMRNCIQQADPPFSQELVERVIRGQRDALARAIDDQEWQLICQVMVQQNVRGEIEYQMLLRSMFIFEYQDEQGTWFGINPVLAETKKYEEWLQKSKAQ